MRTIWKFPVQIQDFFTVTMPKGAKVIAFQNQEGNGPQMWAVVHPERPLEARQFRIVGTGHDAVGCGLYLGTIQTHCGRLIWHLFEEES